MFGLQRSLFLLALVASVSLAEPVEWLDDTTAAEGGSPLYALWSSWTSEALNITTLDPITGAPGPVLWASPSWMLFFPLTPALDHKAKRLFVPLVNVTGQSVSLGVFDLSQAGQGRITLQKTIPVLGSYFFGLHYDAVEDKVWMIASNLRKRSSQSVSASDGIWMECVDISRGVSKNVTALPEGLTIAADGLGGAPTAFDQKNRLLLVPTRTLDSSAKYYWSAFQLNDAQWRSSTLTGYVPVAMYWDSQTASLFALMNSLAAQTGPLSFGTINTLTGKADVFNTWNSTSLVFAVGALAAYDSASAQFYSLVGSGIGPPVALTTISAKTGVLKSAPYFGRSQPDSLSCFN